MKWCVGGSAGVQQRHCSGEEAVLQSAGSGPEGSEPPTREQEGEQSMGMVGGVL